MINNKECFMKIINIDFCWWSLQFYIILIYNTLIKQCNSLIIQLTWYVN